MNRDGQELNSLYEMQLAALGQKGLLVVGRESLGVKEGGYNGGFAPWVEPSEGNLPIDQPGQVAVGGIGTISTVLSYTVPLSSDGVIKYYMIDYSGPWNQGSGDLIFRLLVDGSPLPGFNNIRFKAGAVNNPVPLGGGLRVYSGQTISITVEHAANLGLTEYALARFVGWTYPRKGQ